jgi:hypothetical protein
MPPLGSSRVKGDNNATHTILDPLILDNTFGGNHPSPPLTINVAQSGPQLGMGWGLRPPNVPSAATALNMLQPRLNVIQSAITSATPSGGQTIYTGTIVYPGGVTSYQHYYVVIAGCPSAANNGVFLMTASNATTLTANNTTGVSESCPGATASVFIAELDFGVGGTSPTHYIQWNGLSFVFSDPLSLLSGAKYNPSLLFSSLPVACSASQVSLTQWISDASTMVPGSIITSGTGTPSSATTTEIQCGNDNNWHISPNAATLLGNGPIPTSAGSLGTDSNGHLIGPQAATITKTAAVGSTGAADCDIADGIVCTSNRGVVTLVIGGTGITSGDLFAITWANGFASKPVCMYANQTANTLSGALVNWDLAAETTTKAVFAVNAAATAGTYKIGYTCSN